MGLREKSIGHRAKSKEPEYGANSLGIEAKSKEDRAQAKTKIPQEGVNVLTVLKFLMITMES